MMSEHDPETRRRFQMAFGNLPWVQREVFKLHAAEGYSYAEIALLMGTNVTTVEHQLAKALYKITKQMKGQKLSWRERWF